MISIAVKLSVLKGTTSWESFPCVLFQRNDDAEENEKGRPSILTFLELTVIFITTFFKTLQFIWFNITNKKRYSL